MEFRKLVFYKKLIINPLFSNFSRVIFLTQNWLQRYKFWHILHVFLTE